MHLTDFIADFIYASLTFQWNLQMKMFSPLYVKMTLAPTCMFQIKTTITYSFYSVDLEVLQRQVMAVTLQMFIALLFSLIGISKIKKLFIESVVGSKSKSGQEAK